MNISKVRKTKNSDQLQLSLFFDLASSSNVDNVCCDVNLVLADIKNIQMTVTQLFPDQQMDVLKAERRFKDGKGILFTNGTGTGKTYTGLGIAKRFYLNGKKNILIVVPTDPKAKDWIEDAKNLSLDIIQLTDIKSSGKEIVIMTYANFYQNKALLEREFDLVIYDECHYLTQNENGNQTVYFEAHRNVANLPSTARSKATEFLPAKPSAPEYPQRPNYSDPNYSTKLKEFENLVQLYRENYSDFELRIKEWNQRFEEETFRIWNQTKVVMLSASPFAYHKSCILGDGTLWEINEKLIPEEDFYRGYNVPSGMDEFLTTHFGYRMRYNKPTKAETGVDVNFLERMFFENMVEKGVISGRQLVVDMDYSREFVNISSELGYRINEGMKLFHSYGDEFSEKYKYLKERVHRKWNYLYISQLLEGLKATNVIDRVKKHLELGRKVVIFHGYNNALPSHPFHFNAYSLLDADDRENSHVICELQKEICLFEQEYPELVNLPIETILNARLSLNNAFDLCCREFNGTIPKKKRSQYIKEFNTKNSGVDVFIVQRKAGKEGISLHDILGDCQRVLVDLGLPTAPTDAIQTEGRIYRLGVRSNAIFEYPVLHTDFEAFAFAEKVATRARTAENLAMGNLARNLETAFIEGYLNATDNDPSTEQGTGGLEADRNNIVKEITDFERAKSLYFARGKKSAKNKSAEGVDYFATPEPLGLKMVEWLNLNPDDDTLEPSAGHGAIARFFTSETNNTFIEPSFSLAAQLAINTKGDIKQHPFEDLHIVNKYDGIAMNPPFGTAGKTAIEHLEKAFKHLRTNGRVVAIVPDGPSMQRRIDKFLYEKDEKGRFINPDAHVVAEINLPSVTFSRAGTNVYTKIIIIDRINDIEEAAMTRKIDLSNIQTIDELFDAIEHIEVKTKTISRYRSIQIAS